MGASERKKGHVYEREVCKAFRENGWTEAQTSRYASRKRDDEKVDLCFTPPFNVQCKATKTINMHTELRKMPDDDEYNLVFHKRPRQGTVVAMDEDTFWMLMKKLKGEDSND